MLIVGMLCDKYVCTCVSVWSTCVSGTDEGSETVVFESGGTETDGLAVVSARDFACLGREEGRSGRSNECLVGRSRSRGGEGRLDVGVCGP